MILESAIFANISLNNALKYVANNNATLHIMLNKSFS
jgi:hypothetical protein